MIIGCDGQPRSEKIERWAPVGCIRWTSPLGSDGPNFYSPQPRRIKSAVCRGGGVLAPVGAR
jgi:hypothetical protein